MERIIEIDGRPVKFRATAAVPRLYRIKFRRDIIQDMTAIQKAMEKTKGTAEDLPCDALTMFEDVAYIMAKHADKDAVPSDPGEWLDTFNTFSIYEVFPQIIELWDLNTETMSTPKKK